MFFNKKMSLIAVFCFLGNPIIMAEKAPQIIRMELELERRENQRKEFIRSVRGSTRQTEMMFLAGFISIFMGANFQSLSVMGGAFAMAIGAVGMEERQVNEDDKRFMKENTDYFQEKLKNLEEFCKENEVTLNYVNAPEADKEKIRNSMNKMKADWRNHLENSKKK